MKPDPRDQREPRDLRDEIDPEQGAIKSRPDGRGSDLFDRPSTATDGARSELSELDTRSGLQQTDGVAPSSWRDIKSRFVDDPPGAVAAAEELLQRTVDDKVRALKDEAAAMCVRERDEDASSTETLRARLVRYEGYAERLASMSVRGG